MQYTQVLIDANKMILYKRLIIKIAWLLKIAYLTKNIPWIMSKISNRTIDTKITKFQYLTNY